LSALAGRLEAAAMADERPVPDDLDALASRHLDGGLDAGGQARLAAWIKADPANARAFARQAVLHDQLRAALRYEASADMPPEAAEAGRRAGARRFRLVSAGAAAVFLLALAAGLLVARRGAGFAAPPAMLEAAADARWDDPDVDLVLRGGGLPAGPMRLQSGVAEFRLGAGATAAVLGPAEFEVAGPLRLVLRRGRILMRCPSKDSRFVVETPGVTLAGLGAEFVVGAGPGLHVFAASLRGALVVTVDDEPTAVEAGGAVRVGEGRKPVRAAPRLDDFAALLRAPAAPDVVPDNLLADPGFESGCASNDEEPRPGGPAWRGTPGHVDILFGSGRNGTAALRIRALGNRLWPWAGQTVAAVPLAGRRVTASVRAQQPADDPLRGRQCAILKLYFRDAAGRETAYAERRFLWGDDAVGAFVEARLATVAPAEAASVQLQVMLNACGLATGTVLFDDARLAVAPAR
jgi:hypothetical protein